jgi:FkbM family methyltransferase
MNVNVYGALVSMRIMSHLKRVQYQFGKSLKLGKKTFKVRGYHADRLATDFAHEPHFVALLERLFQDRSGAFIDIGTNVGQTLIKVVSIDPTREYVGFEPQIDCCFYIDRFIRNNLLTNASIFPIVLSDRNGMLKLYFNSDYDEMASTFPGAGQSKWVLSRVGDEVLSEMSLSNVAIIKIDVEGAELEVLRGLEVSMRKWRPLLIFEVLPNFTGEERTMLPAEMQQINDRRSAEIAELLVDRGYKLYQVDANGREIAIHAFNLNDAKNYIGRDYVARPTTDQFIG